MTELVVATKNKKKLEELKDLLCDLDIKITSLADYPNHPKIIEDGLTFQENAIKKAATIAMFSKKLTLGEDSGLEVRALNNKPGVYSARYSGDGATDKKNNIKLLKELKKVPFKNRQARYRCSIALADAKGLIGVVHGDCRGVIGAKPKGSSGFGYDPIFVIPKFNKTFAELGLKIKHTMSHRFKAIQKIKESISKYLRKYS